MVYPPLDNDWTHICADVSRAADRIAALEAENLRLREALRSLLVDWHDCMGHRDMKGERDAIAALSEGGGDA